MTDNISVAEVMFFSRRALELTGDDTAGLDAEVLLAHVLGRDRAWLYAHGDYRLADAERGVFENLLSRRKEGVPVPYLVGHKEFFGLDFWVTPDVLIPRPDTEILVETALRCLPPEWGQLSVADVGVGSGAISVCLAVHRPAARFVATDVSAAALQVARSNAGRHQVENRFAWVQTDLLGSLKHRFDLIVANPPYVESDRIPRLGSGDAGGLAWEPRLALDGGRDGLDQVCRLLPMVRDHLAARGLFLMELGAGQAERVRALADKIFSGASINIIRDYAERQRVLLVHLQNNLPNKFGCDRIAPHESSQARR